VRYLENVEKQEGSLPKNLDGRCERREELVAVRS